MTKAERRAAIKAQNEARAGHDHIKDRATKQEIWSGDAEQVARFFNREATFYGRMAL